MILHGVTNVSINEDNYVIEMEDGMARVGEVISTMFVNLDIAITIVHNKDNGQLEVILEL